MYRSHRVEMRSGAGKLASTSHMSLRVRVRHGGLEVLLAAPLGVVDDPSAVEAGVQVRGDEPWSVPHDLLGRFYEESDQLLLGGLVDFEDVDQGHRSIAGSNHGLARIHVADGSAR